MIKNKEVQAILGPTTSTQAAFIIKLGEKAQVPVISFSASSPSLTSVQSPYFFQATQNDKTQVEEITSTIQAFGWTEAVPIYIDNEYGMGILPYLIDALQAIGIHIPYKSAISPWASDDEIMEELYKLKKMEARVFIVHMFPSLGARHFYKAKEVGMMTEGYAWIMSDGMTNSLSSLDPSIFDSVYGVVLGVKPYVSKTKEVEKFQDQWKRKFNLDYPDMIDVDLNIYGLWAYDAATALAMAIEKVFGNGNFCFQKKNISSNLTDLETLGVSENGPELAQALSNTSFKGLTGDFHFVNQQLQPSLFQIVNINGKPKGIELSIKEKRLVRKLHATTNPRENSPSLAPSAQPMDLTCVPMELEIQKKNWLRIGMPVKEGFLEFVKVRRNPITNKTTVSGYCIDLFDAAMKGLPNAPPYCYIPFAKPDGERAGSYDKLVYQVFIGNYSAVVGDVSIIASRSHHVDFTLPYMEYEERVNSKLTRVEVIISCFVVLLLIQSYTAALSSYLTLQQLRPSINDVNELIKMKEKVGYQEGSFVFRILKSWGFDESKLIAYKSAKDCSNLLSKGSKNGGIAAAFEEMPYIDFILEQNCSQYEVLQPKLNNQQFQTDGFGFVFPKGSDLARIFRGKF
ncbi:hypothetical protein GH714_017574 [Hevea brasiliensis]|uniref:Ionotropic glutamate receptor C-terminal domain-containing protein n=1 Tax=Hevea brasiliensis TaxID=3981 RepID=A0A6A6N8Q7_HEVBR|nr:hypothetical protein GH714_017574 [Hevea brasiliensis]